LRWRVGSREGRKRKEAGCDRWKEAQEVRRMGSAG